MSLELNFWNRMERDKTGIEILFEQAVKTSIHMTPPEELMEGIYKAMWCISSSEHGCGDYNFSPDKLRAEQVTALSILSKAGLVEMIDCPKHYEFTPKGKAINASLIREGAYNHITRKA